MDAFGPVLIVLGGLGVVLFIGFLVSSAVYWLMDVNSSRKQAQTAMKYIEIHAETINELRKRIDALEAKPAVWEEIAELKHRIVVLEQRNG